MGEQGIGISPLYQGLPYIQRNPQDMVPPIGSPQAPVPGGPQIYASSYDTPLLGAPGQAQAGPPAGVLASRVVPDRQRGRSDFMLQSPSGAQQQRVADILRPTQAGTRENPARPIQTGRTGSPFSAPSPVVVPPATGGGGFVGAPAFQSGGTALASPGTGTRESPIRPIRTSNGPLQGRPNFGTQRLQQVLR